MGVSGKTTVGKLEILWKHVIRKVAVVPGLVIAVALGMAPNASAANWLMLQGTSPDNAPRVKVWGFIQPTYQHDFSDANAQGLYVPPKLIGPDLDDQSAFNIQRARLGVRGRILPRSDKIDYFFLSEFGNDGITNGGRYGHYRPRITDASLTLSYVEGARIRVGLFKTPGAEEGMQSVFATDPYVNYTNVTNQLLQDRFPAAGDFNIKPQPTPHADMNGYSEPVGAFRDTGVEVFDAFDLGAWEHSYAVMLGNGHGLQLPDNNGAKDYYLYWSSARLFTSKGSGALRPGAKFFAWYQAGERTDAYDVSREHNRKRYGVGVTYRRSSFHATGEYVGGRGMIFQGPQNPQSLFNDFRARGGYIEGGWDIPRSPWELDLRCDAYVRNEGLPTRTVFQTVTAGVQYHFTRVDRITLNYAFNDFSSDAPGIENQLAGVNGRLSVEVTLAF